MHLHLSFLDALFVAFVVIIFGFFWRWASAQLSDTTLGQAMSVIY